MQFAGKSDYITPATPDYAWGEWEGSVLGNDTLNIETMKLICVASRRVTGRLEEYKEKPLKGVLRL